MARVMVAGLVLCAPGFTQGLIVDTYNEVDGLPSSMVFDIREAPSGLLWFATRSGVVEYDGDSWTPVFPDLSQTGRDTLFLRFDRAGDAWVVLSDGMVVRHGTGGGSDEREVVRQASGLMETGHVLDFEVLDTEWGTMAALTGSRKGLSVWGGERWNRIASEAVGGRVSVIEPFQGALIVGSEGGLFRLDAEGRVSSWAEEWAPPPGSIHGLCRGQGRSGEELWILGEGWLGRLDSLLNFELIADALSRFDLDGGGRPVSVVAGRDSVLLGTGTALVAIDRKTRRIAPICDDSGDAVMGVNRLYTREGDLIWGATDTGAIKILDTGLQFMTKATGLFADEVTAITTRAKGGVVLGHYGGLTLLSEGQATRLAFDGFDPTLPAFTRVMDLTSDGDGNVWIACAGFGVGRLSEAGELNWWRPPPEQDLWVNAVHETPDGSLLVGTTQGLWTVGASGMEREPEEELAELFIRRIEVGRDGTVYMATPRSIWLRRPTPTPASRTGSWRQIDPGSERREHFYTVFEDRRGTVWCGGRWGLWRLDQDQLQRPGPKLNLGRTIYSLCEDQAGRLWIGSGNGFLRSNGRELEDFGWFADRTGHESNRAAAILGGDGRVWMGTTRGVTIFEPEFGIERVTLPIELLEVRVGAKKVPHDRTVELPVGQSSLSFRVRALSLLDEHEVEFRSRLVGLSDWQLSSGSTVLERSFTGLPPGRFRFEVQARGPGGKFGDVWESPQVVVAEPIWKRAWFLVLLTASGAVLLASAYSYVIQRRQARHLVEEVAERTRDLESSLAELAKTDRLRSLGFLAGGIAHDLRNVLTVLTGNLSLLRERLSDREDLSQFLNPIDGALDRATQLSSQLQTFSTGGAPIKRAISLAEVVQECADLLLCGSRVTVELKIEEGIWPADADQAQVRQVIENLLMNARQCQPTGGWVCVRGRNVVREGSLESDHDAGRAEERRFVEISVTDGGPGISLDELRHIFDPFYSTKPGGSGLGLTTAFSIARRHGGTLEVESTEGGGATFRLLLPAASDGIREVDLQPVVRLPAGLGRVLVVDDDPNIRTLLVSMLTRLGYEAVASGGSVEALEALKRAQSAGKPFRFAIVDHTLPGDLSGPEILQQLRRFQPDLRAIASSGYSADAALSQHEVNGFQGVLPKPYRMSDLARAMSNLARESSGVTN